MQLCPEEYLDGILQETGQRDDLLLQWICELIFDGSGPGEWKTVAFKGFELHPWGCR